MKWTVEHIYWLPLVRSDQGDILLSALVDKRHDGEFGWVVSTTLENERTGARSGVDRCLVNAMRAANEAANAVAKELGFTALCHAWQCHMELKAKTNERLVRVTPSCKQYRYIVMRRSDLRYISSGYCATLPEAIQQVETFMAKRTAA